MIRRDIREDGVIVFRRGNEMVGFIKENVFGNVIYQKWWDDVKVRNIVGHLHDVDEWVKKEYLTDEEFDELVDLIEDNAVLW